jgi:hypothetical protein
MAAGLIDHPWTLRELLLLKVPLPPWVAPKRREHPPKQKLQPNNGNSSVTTVKCGATARPLRVEFSGVIYQVTSRGNAREDICLDGTDRAIFLGVLAEVISRFEWRCHAYCLMGNHYHMLKVSLTDEATAKGFPKSFADYKVICEWADENLPKGVRLHKRHGI